MACWKFRSPRFDKNSEHEGEANFTFKVSRPVLPRKPVHSLEVDPFISFFARSRRMLRKILPEGFLGISSTKTMPPVIRLWRETLPSRNLVKSCSRVALPCFRTMYARGRSSSLLWPNRGQRRCSLGSMWGRGEGKHDVKGKVNSRLHEDSGRLQVYSHRNSDYSRICDRWMLQKDRFQFCRRNLITFDFDKLLIEFGCQQPRLFES